MDLAALGWNAALDECFALFREKQLEAARVAVEDKHHYVLLTASGELTGQVAGKLLHHTPPSELPKVGDWVAIAPLPNENKAVIHHVLPRRTRLSRKVPGRTTEEQVLVTNVDVGFVVQALDDSFNPRRMQRHLMMVLEGGVQPVVLLNKIDLCADLDACLAEAKEAAADAPVLPVCAISGQGIDSLAGFVQARLTVVFIGSSGVGKSSLINRLYGGDIQATTEVRECDAKGRHTTTWREMILLPRGGLVIDTPGMREFHIWQGDEGLHEAFPDIEELAVRCHFRDCGHKTEKRCAVQAALECGELPRDRYESYLKLKRELEYFHQAHEQRGYLERKRRGKMAQRAFNKIKRSVEE